MAYLRSYPVTATNSLLDPVIPHVHLLDGRIVTDAQQQAAWRMTERWPCLAARYRGATWTNNSRLARKLIVDLTLPPRLAHPMPSPG